jgi:hypothetical protein
LAKIEGTHVLNPPVQDQSLLYIVLNAWVPAFVTVILGGFVASIVVPGIQRRYQRYQMRLDKKTELCEGTAKAFGRYIVSWRRLRQISELERQRALTPEEADRKRGFVAERNSRRDDLFDCLRVCRLYSSQEVCSELVRFMAWDGQQSAIPLSDLPPLDDWRRWEGQLIGMLKNDIR